MRGGIAGNYLSVVTLRRDRSLRTSVTKFLLTVLAVADLAFLLPVVVVIMLPAYCDQLRQTCAVAVQQAIPWRRLTMCKLLSSLDLSQTFPNVETALRVYLCMMVSNTSSKRSFSKLEESKGICDLQWCRRATMTLMSIQHELLRSLDFIDTIEEFALAKAVVPC